MGFSQKEKEQLFKSLEILLQEKTSGVNLSLFNGDKVEIFSRLTRVESTNERIEQVLNTKFDNLINLFKAMPCSKHDEILTSLNEKFNNNNIQNTVTNVKLSTSYKILILIASFSGIFALVKEVFF